jgi:hypothetical protein
MKKIKVSILALSVLVGGAVFASAASSVLLGATSDIALTNAVPLIWSSVNTLPTSPFLVSSNVSFEAMFVDTDNGGKIAGVGNVIKRYYDGSNVVAISSWYTTVKGTIKASQMATPSVNMTLKGEGYSAPGTNTTIILNGQSSDAFPGKFSLTFSAKNTAAISNNFAYHILGNLKGTLTPAVKGAKQEKVDQAADLIVNRSAVNELDMRVIVSGTKVAAISYGSPDGDIGGATGTATIKNGAYTLNLKPVMGGSSSLQLKGQIAAVTSAPFTNISTINTADVKGKIQGQAVQGTAFRFGGFFAD